MFTINSMIRYLSKLARRNNNDYEPIYIKRVKPSARKRHFGGLRGTGYTRQIHEESKARRKMAAKSRRINRRK